MTKLQNRILFSLIHETVVMMGYHRPESFKNETEERAYRRLFARLQLVERMIRDKRVPFDAN